MAGGNGAWQVTARPRTARWLAIVGAVAVLAAMVVVAVLLPTVPTGVYFRFADQVALVLLGVLMAAGLLLIARPRVRAGGAGVEVRTVLTTRTYSWDEVRGFSFPDGAPWAHLELADDDYMPLVAVQAADGQHAVVAMRGLRALHAANRSEPLP